MIIITSKREGFRRCGVAHAAGPTQWPDGRWTEAELAALMAEPMLTVAQAADDPPPGDATPPPLGLVEIDQPGTEFNSVPREVNADPAVIEVDPPAAPEPYEVTFDEPAPAPKAPSGRRKK